MLKIKVYKVDGVTVVGAWVNNQFKQEVDTHSQLSVKEAKEFLKSQYG